MATLIVLLVFVLFLGAILTGGYNKKYLERMRENWLWSWITTVDHKRIGILYLIGGGFFFAVAGLEALLIRIQLMFPDNSFIVGDTFNQLFTMHGTTMLFLVALPILFGFMNFVVPLQIGARDVAFPFLNNLGFWLYISGGLLLNLSWLFGGAPDAGWTNYATLALNDYSPGPGVNYYVLGLQIAGLGTLMSAINFITTIVNMRAPGMSYLRLPMFTWTTFVTSALIMFAFPPLTAGLFMMMFDRIFGANFFTTTGGGNVTVWQHIFWIFGHPEVYILILPAFGVFSDVISTFSRKRLFGYHSMVFAVVLIGFLGFMVWLHHMFTVGLGPVANSIFAISTMAIAVPTGIKIFNWLFTMWGGRIRFTTAMLYAAGFIVSFVMGGVTGVMLGVVPADLQFHDTYFVVAHFHYVIIGGTVFGIMTGFYYWWPKMFGTVLNEKLGKWNFWLFFFGFHLTFFPQHFLGLNGMPRRVYTFEANKGLETGNLVSTIGTFLMTIALLILLYNVAKSIRKGEPASGDPWDGRSLEWAVSSPPPAYNFAQTPRVRGLDAWWLEKVQGDGKLKPAEPLGPIHMPSPSYLPFIMAVGFFISGFGFVFHSWQVGALGLVVVFVTMYIRSFEEDHGFHIQPDELKPQGGGKLMRIEEQTGTVVGGLPAEPEKATLEGKNKIVGFWLFLAAESTLFATEMGAYVALKGSHLNGPPSQELFQLPMVALSTLILLVSSLTSVLGVMSMHTGDARKMLTWFGLTVLLGAAFLGLETYEFMEYVHEGHTLTGSAFASSFYLLLGTHGAHVLFGVLWILGLVIQGAKKGITVHTAPKFYLASLYWHFIDVVWIFIFTVVYLMGMI